MAANDNDLFQLAQIRKRELSEHEIDIVNLWASATIQATRESAAEAARRIDKRCPSLQDTDQTAEFVWTLWDIMLDIASSPDVTSHIQERLVSVVLELQQIDKGTVTLDLGEQRMWKDLPDFGIALGAHYKDPTEAELELLTEQRAQIWVKLNQFLARLLASGASEAYRDAMSILRLALEEQLPTAIKGAVVDCRVQAASVWILHAAKNFFEWAQENVHPETPEPEAASYLVGGSLYSGRPIMCPERWGYWLHRLEELGTPGSGLGTQTSKLVLEAVQVMRTVEAGVSSA